MVIIMQDTSNTNDDEFARDGESVLQDASNSGSSSSSNADGNQETLSNTVNNHLNDQNSVEEMIEPEAAEDPLQMSHSEEMEQPDYEAKNPLAKESNAEFPDSTESKLATPIINQSCKKIMKSILKKAANFTSSECLWLTAEIASKLKGNQLTEDKQKICEMIKKHISTNSTDHIKELMKKVENFKSGEFRTLLKKLKRIQTKHQNSNCGAEFSQSIMWLKTHFEICIGQFITKTDLTNSYGAYCQNKNIQALKTLEFLNLFKIIYPDAKEKRRDPSGVKRYVYLDIKWRDSLNSPKLPIFGTNQLHNNLLLSQYIWCHDCCLLHSQLLLKNKNIKIKIGGNQSQIVIHDPEQLLIISAQETVEQSPESSIPIIDLCENEETNFSVQSQVAKKSVFSKRIRRIPYKYRESPTSDVSRNIDSGFSNKLLKLKKKLSKLVVLKSEEDSTYKLMCKCCQEFFLITEQQGIDLLSAQSQLNEFASGPLCLSKSKHKYHTSIKSLLNKNASLILPKQVLYTNISPSVSLNRFEVYEWFQNELSTLKHKLMDNSINRKNQLEALVVPEVALSNPPNKVSAVPELPEREPPKIEEVYIKSESEEPRKKRSRESETAIISNQKRTKSTNPAKYFHGNMAYDKEKGSVYAYFPAMDTSNNLGLANFGTMYKCILCLMLFNTKEKLKDHEKNHIFCHRCGRKLRNIELMRQHLIKHCERNAKKRKPILRIHKVDSLEIMVKRYRETFEMCKAYYKPKKKYKEMKRLKVESSPPGPAIEEVFIDEKPNINNLLEPTGSTNNIALEMLFNIQPQPTEFVNVPSINEVPVMPTNINLGTVLSANGTSHGFNTIVPPLLIPFSSTTTNARNVSNDCRRYKIRVKDLFELT